MIARALAGVVLALSSPALAEPAPQPANANANGGPIAAPSPPDPFLPFPIDVTASVIAGYRTEAEYGEIFGRLNAATVKDVWSLSLRLDTASFVSPPSDEVDDRYTLEKATAGYTGRSLEVTAGDGYVSFGRGLGLSLRKLDELGIDTTVRGAKVLVHEGLVNATLVAGYANINNVDEATGTGEDDPYDLIGGAQAQVLLADKINVGGYAAVVAFRDQLGLVPNDDYTDRSTQVGLIADSPRLTPHVGVYGEVMAQSVSTEPESSEPTGFAGYGTATGYFGKATLLFEGKAYGALTPLKPNLENTAFAAVAYNNPPTVERVLQIIENPSRHVGGGRMRFDWAFSPTLLTFVNYGLFRDWEGYADPEDADNSIRPGTIHDPYAGVEARWDEASSWAIVSAGWRVVQVDGSSSMVRGDGHVEYDVTQSLGGRYSLNLHGLHDERRKRESVILDETFREGTVLLGVTMRPHLTVAGGYDYTTEPTQPQRDYWNGNIGWDITSSSSLRLFFGAQRGGLRCVSGVCRIVPPYEGVKLTATVRF